MAPWVTIRPSGHRFIVEGRDSILQAGLKAGLALAYGCSNGNCGECRARLVDGSVERLRHSDFAFRAWEKDQGFILMCTQTPRPAGTAEVVLEAAEAASTEEIPKQRITVRITRIDRSNDRVAVVQARTPCTQRFRFLAGQSVKLSAAGIGGGRAAGASCPCDDRNLEFHIARGQGNAVSRHLFGAAAANDRIDLVGPHGSFVLRQGDERQMIFVAEDTGFAPVRSLIEHAMSLDEAAAISLYRMTTGGGGPYMANLCRSWSDAFDDFRYTTVHGVDGGDPRDLMARIADDHADLAACDVYAAGSPGFLDAARSLLPGHGLRADRLFLESMAAP